MKQLIIKKIETGTVEASAVPALLDAQGIEWNPIACVNWAEYPYQPEVKFRAAHIGDAILLHYQVTEASVRAVALADDGKVWEDACVEFFLSPEVFSMRVQALFLHHYFQSHLLVSKIFHPQSCQ